MKTVLETRQINSIAEAPAMLGVRHVVRNTSRVPVVFMPRGGCGCCIVIPKGFVGLVSSFGEYKRQIGPGLHRVYPWITVSHLIPTQTIIFDTPVKECPTADNVMVSIDIAIVLRIKTEDAQAVHNFIFQLTPQGLDSQLSSFQEESIRQMARNRKYTQIYDLMDTASDKQLEIILRDLNEHFGKFGVEITNIAVTNVHLPPEFSKPMQETTIWSNRNEYKNLQQQYDLRKIEINQTEEKTRQKYQDDLVKFTEEKEKDIASKQRQKQNVLALTSKELAEIKELEQSEVLEISTNARYEISEINSKRDISVAKVKSEGQASSEYIRIECDSYVKTKQAETELEIAKNTAKCLQISSNAELEAAKLLVSKRQYEEKMRHLQTLRALASNPSVSITGDSKDNMLAQLLANQQNGVALGINFNKH